MPPPNRLKGGGAIAPIAPPWIRHWRQYSDFLMTHSFDDMLMNGKKSRMLFNIGRLERIDEVVVHHQLAYCIAIKIVSLLRRIVGTMAIQ